MLVFKNKAPFQIDNPYPTPTFFPKRKYTSLNMSELAGHSSYACFSGMGANGLVSCGGGG